ncbi:FadR family transcriptional regulator [Sagittula sp. NFXS13]|uniref:FadR/GntR family transcriptional regulator n=1 Tax=Sagittula sp. NFXS13 TaxID=2819095 RepID=UPI0032DF7302
MSLRGQPLKVNYAYKQIAEQIQTQILDGTITPGDRLPGETELAEMFGVTRSTVREGLRQLESDGLVCRPTPRRLEVAMPRIDQLATRSWRAMVLMNVTFRELWQVALETEPLAASLAAECATDHELEELEELHRQLVDATDDEELSIKLDTAFHSKIAEISKNRVLSLAREPIALLLFQGFSKVAPNVPQALDRQIVAHAEVLEAIRKRDPERARLWARRHIEDFWRGVQLARLEDETPMAKIKGS